MKCLCSLKHPQSTELFETGDFQSPVTKTFRNFEITFYLLKEEQRNLKLVDREVLTWQNYSIGRLMGRILSES